MNINLKKYKKCIFFTTISFLALLSIYVVSNDDIIYYNKNITSPLFNNITSPLFNNITNITDID